MSKKNFKNNPALQFISQVEKTEKEKIPVANEALEKLKIEQKNELENENKVKNELNIESKTKEIQSEKEKYKKNPLHIETRSKRVNLLIQPTLLVFLKKKAQKQKISTNELIHRVLEEHIKQSQN